MIDVLDFMIFKKITDRTCLSTRSPVSTYTNTFKLSNHNTCTADIQCEALSEYRVINLELFLLYVLPVCLIVIICNEDIRSKFSIALFESLRDQ